MLCVPVSRTDACVAACMHVHALRSTAWLATMLMVWVQLLRVCTACLQAVLAEVFYIAASLPSRHPLTLAPYCPCAPNPAPQWALSTRTQHSS